MRAADVDDGVAWVHHAHAPNGAEADCELQVTLLQTDPEARFQDLPFVMMWLLVGGGENHAVDRLAGAPA